MDHRSDFPDEGKQDGENGRPADDPGAVDTGNGHDPHVFPVGGIGRGSQEPGQHVGQPVSHQGTVEPGILDEVTAHNVAGDEQMAQVFRQHHKERRKDHHDGGQVEPGLIEGGKGEPGSRFHGGKVHYPMNQLSTYPDTTPIRMG